MISISSQTHLFRWFTCKRRKAGTAGDSPPAGQKISTFRFRTCLRWAIDLTSARRWTLAQLAQKQRPMWYMHTNSFCPASADKLLHRRPPLGKDTRWVQRCTVSDSSGWFAIAFSHYSREFSRELPQVDPSRLTNFLQMQHEREHFQKLTCIACLSYQKIYSLFGCCIQKIRKNERL